MVTGSIMVLPQSSVKLRSSSLSAAAMGHNSAIVSKNKDKISNDLITMHYYCKNKNILVYI